MDLKGKKLLVLGGNAISCEIVKAARDLGVYVIVTDWNRYEDSPAKQIADEYWNDSLMDYEALVPKIKENAIDGILTGFADSYLLPYHHLCELTGLPCYASREVFQLTMDKARFKQFCRENDVLVIPEYDLASFNPDTIDDKNKVIVKPVDNSGSRGVSLCSNPTEFRRCLDYSLSYSAKKQVLIEKYMEMDSVSASYTVQDGELVLSTFNDRYIHKSADGGSVTCLSIYPSKYLDSYLSLMNQKVCRMYSRLGVRNGVLSVQFFTDGESYYVMEMGHRLTGGQHYTYSKAENGISSLDQLIHFSLTGKMADFEIARVENPHFRHLYCHLYLLGKEGTVSRIDGMEELKDMPETIRLSPMKKVGDRIGRDGTSEQKILGIHLMLSSRAELPSLLSRITDVFKVYDEAGNNLVLPLDEQISMI